MPFDKPERPAYADFDTPAKFQAIEAIIAKRLLEHPNAVCSYSGGSDSDIMLDLIERVRKIYELPPIHYFFINTGLEMEATKRHVKETAEKYNITIETIRPKRNIVLAVRDNGQPFYSKIFSQQLGGRSKRTFLFPSLKNTNKRMTKWQSMKNCYSAIRDAGSKLNVCVRASQREIPRQLSTH